MNSLLTSKPTTELPTDHAIGLDTQEPAHILGLLLDGQISAASSVNGAIGAIELAAKSAAVAIAAGNNLAYVGAGSSGLMAMADALELPGTFGVPTGQIRILMAGGNSSLSDLAGTHEDNEEKAKADVEAADVLAGDCALCVSASGTTPYTVKAAHLLRQRGVTTVALANNENSPLLKEADIPVLLATPPELIPGSTRMGAGTAQKIALNMISTMMAVHLGHVHDGLMVNLTADNEKLRRRASGIISTITGCQAEQSDKYLDQAGGSVKAAVLLARGVSDVATAKELLVNSNGNLRAALAAI